MRELQGTGELVAAVVFGSVARGDFNAWSDVDLLLVMRNLPPRPPDRLLPLVARAPAGVQPIAWSPDEFVTQLRAANPIAREAVGAGVPLHGREELARLAALA